jgi:hypothetical protein
VAAFIGADIPGAIGAPDLPALAAMTPMAHDAIRERLAHLVTADPAGVEAGLHARGL